MSYISVTHHVHDNYTTSVSMASKSSKLVRLSVNITQSQLQKLQKYAEHNEWTKTQAVQELIKAIPESKLKADSTKEDIENETD